MVLTNGRIITYGNNQFVAVGINGTILTSPDAINWTSRNSGANTLDRVTYGNNQFVAVGINGTILTSPDAIRGHERLRKISYAKELII